MIDFFENGLEILGLSVSDLTILCGLGVIVLFIFSCMNLALSLKILKRVPKVKTIVDQKTKQIKYSPKKLVVKPKTAVLSKEKQKSEHCLGDQFIGFLQLWPKGRQLPDNCVKCGLNLKCLQGKKSKIKKILPVVTVFCLFSLMFSGSFVVAPVLASSESSLVDEASYTVFGEDDWAHVSVDGETVGSVAFQMFGDDVQLIFYAYNDPGLSFDRFVIEKNVAEHDPFSKFSVLWDGQTSGDGRIYLKFYSSKGQTSTVVEGFGGETSHYGRPGRSVQKTIITVEGELLDVRDEDENPVCSFEWEFVSKVENNETVTVPQLTVYEVNGDVFDVKTMSNTMTPVIEHFDNVGFMAEELGEDYVKWILYSGKSFTTQSNQGFNDLDLPFFKVEPVSQRVEVDQEVTVTFILPDGVASDDYEASWENSKIWNNIVLLSDDVYPNGEHIVVFKFLDSFTDKEVTLKVSCERYGTPYSSTAKITVTKSGTVGMVIALVFVIAFIVALFVGFKRMFRYRAGPVSARDVSLEVTGQ